MAYQSLLIAASALLVTLSFPAWYIWPLIGIALVPALIVLDRPGTSIKQSLWWGLAFGTLLSANFHNWLLPLNYWVGWPLIILAWVAFALYQGVVYGAIFAAIRWLRPWAPLWITAPILWMIGEWIKGVLPLGNQAANLGYALVDFTWMAQLASVGGVPLLTFGVVLINVLIARSFVTRRLPVAATAAGILGVWITSGALLTWHYSSLPTEKSVTVSIIQGNHRQTDKLDVAHLAAIWRHYFNETRNVSASSDLVFWPETIVPVPLFDYPGFKSSLQTLSSQSGTSIVGGLPRSVGTHQANSTFAIDPTHADAQYYDKHRLMPFGEYLPFRSALSSISALKSITTMLDYLQGNSNTPLDVNHMPIATALCLESLDPKVFKAQTRNGAQLLFVAANNAWYMDSSAAEKHFSMSRMRAIENHRYLIQAANTGISGIVDPNGKVVTRSTLNSRTVVKGAITPLNNRTIYSHF